MIFSGTRRTLLGNRQKDYTWNVDAAGNWSNPANWTGGKDYPHLPGDIARFGNKITANRIVTVDVPVSVSQIYINDDQNYTISGTPAITMDSSSCTINVAGAGTPTISCPLVFQSTCAIANTPALTISGIISGAGGVTKSGAGTLTLSGVNTYTGKNNYSAGTVSVAADSAFGATPGGAVADSITMSGGSIAFTTGFTMSSNRGMTLTANATLDTTSGQTIAYNGIITGAFRLTKTSSGTLNTQGTNTYSGGLTITAGIMRFTADAQFGTAPGSPVANSIEIGNGGQLIASSGFTLNANRGITLVAASGAVISVSAGTLTYNGIITGTAAWSKTGSGQLDLGGVNTFVGTVNVSGGGFRGAVANALPTTTILTMSNTAGVSFIHDFNQSIDRLTGGGVTGGGAVLATGTTLTCSTTGSNSYAGVISGLGGFTQANNSGTPSLTGACTYTGATQIDGPLSIDGSITSNVTVSSTGQLRGTGTVTGVVTIQNSGVLSPALVSSVGNLNIVGSMVTNASSVWTWTHSTTTVDTVTITTGAGTGNLTLDGTINFATAASLTVGTYTLATFTGTLTNNTLNIGTNNTGRSLAIGVAVPNTIQLLAT